MNATADAQKLVQMAEQLSLDGGSEGAQLLFQQALRLDPFNAKARAALGKLRTALPPKNVSAPVAAMGRQVIVPPAPGDEVTRPAGDVVEMLITTAQSLLRANDVDGAVDFFQRATEVAPDDDRVTHLGRAVQAAAWPKYERRLAPLTRRPTLKLSNEDLLDLSFVDHRMGFLLSQIDGRISLEQLFSVSAMTRLYTASTLIRMIDGGIVVLPPTPPGAAAT